MLGGFEQKATKRTKGLFGAFVIFWEGVAYLNNSPSHAELFTIQRREPANRSWRTLRSRSAETLSISILAKDRLAAFTAVHDVIDAPGYSMRRWERIDGR